MQPNPWDDGEPMKAAEPKVPIQDSAIVGDVHIGATIHNHEHSERPESISFDASPQMATPAPIIVGLPQQMNAPMGQQIMYLQPQSSAPKVLGIFVIIWGAFALLGIFANFLPQTDLVTGEVLVLPVSVIALSVINGILVGFTCIVGGSWMTQYKRKGIHLVLIGILVSYFVNILGVFLGGDGGLGLLFENESAVIAIFAVVQGICSVICGLLVAIPLMTSAPGLDDSSLFRRLK